MSLLAQVCLVVVTLAAVAVAVAVLRALSRVEKASEQLTRMSEEFQHWVTGAHDLTREAREVLVSARGIVTPLRRVADRFELLGDRTASLSAAVLGEIEPPVRTAVAAVRGIKSVTAFFMEQLVHRFSPGRTATPEGIPHE